MRKGDLVLSSDFLYGIVLNMYHVGVVDKDMVDIEVVSSHPALGGQQRTFYEHDLIVMQEAQDA